MVDVEAVNATLRIALVSIAVAFGVGRVSRGHTQPSLLTAVFMSRCLWESACAGIFARCTLNLAPMLSHHSATAWKPVRAF